MKTPSSMEEWRSRTMSCATKVLVGCGATRVSLSGLWRFKELYMLLLLLPPDLSWRKKLASPPSDTGRRESG